MRAAPRAADRGAELPSLGISYLISLAAGAPSHRPRFLFEKGPSPPPTNAPAPQRCAAPLLRPSARASGSRAASSLHPRTPRSRRGTGARAAAAQQELHCERQPAPYQQQRTTNAHAPRPLALPSMCPHTAFAAPASALGSPSAHLHSELSHALHTARNALHLAAHTPPTQNGP